MWVKKAYHLAETGIAKLSLVFGTITIIFLSVMVLLTVSDIFMRYVFNKPIQGSLELSEYLIVIAGFSAIGWCALNNKHVRVGIIVDRLSPRLQAIIDGITFIVALPVIALCVRQSIVQAGFEQSINSASEILGNL